MGAATLPNPEPVVLPVAELRRLARDFDAISDETGARYSAQAFVDFVAAELAADEAGGPAALL